MIQTIARWGVISTLFLITLIPMYMSGQLFFPFITGKAFAFRILVEIALASYLLLVLVDRKYRPRFSWTLVIFGVFTAWVAVADAFGVLPVKAFWSNFERMDGWVTLIHVFALFLITGAVFSVEKLWRKWWLAVIAVSVIVCLHGVMQILHVPGFAIHQGGVRADANFGNAIYLAVYLMFTLFVTAWQAIVSRGWLRNLLLCLIPIQLLVLVAASSRGALIGLVAGVVLSAALFLFESRKQWKDSLAAKIALGVLIALTLSAGAFFLARDTAFVKSDPSLSRMATVFSLGQELSVRSTLWSIALEGAKDRPIVGWGQEGFSQVFNTYYHPSLYEQESWFDRAHNTYLDWLVAGGVPALVLFILLLGFAFVALFRAKGMEPAERILLIGALGAYAVQAIAIFDNLWSYIPLAVILAMAHASSSREIPALAKLPEARSTNATGAAVAAIAVIAVALMWSVNVPNIRAASHLVYAISPIATDLKVNYGLFEKALADHSFGDQEIREQLVQYTTRVLQSKKVPDELKLSFVALANKEMEAQIAQSPNDARLRVLAATMFDATGEFDRALEQIDAAILLSPKKQTLHLKRAYELWSLNRDDEALEAAKYARDLDPSFPSIAVSAAYGMILNGDLAEGKALLTEAVGTTTLDDDQLFYAYYQAKAYPDLILVAAERVTVTKGDPEARYRLAQAYAAAGQFENARREIVFTIAEHPEAKAAGEALMKEIFVPAR
ncbi:MAG: O-antigen ligase [Parcubacteria bacterium C7867-004]|nr:MAG: O-antigen ligase [Parcubacteria bacterium C7867-004]